jgi:hypothetical protein
MIDQEFKNSLPLMNEIIAICQKWPVPTISDNELAGRLFLHVEEIIRLFDLLGLEPAEFDDPQNVRHNRFLQQA